MKRVGWVTAWALSVATTGCAHFRAASAEEAYRREAVERFVYRQPCAKLWPNLRKALFSDGLEVKDADSGESFSIETAPTPVAGDATSRYLITGQPVDNRSCRVEALQQVTKPKDRPKTERDFNLEWRLIERLDQGAAEKINDDADAAGDAAR
jgi:hypothetical protein